MAITYLRGRLLMRRQGQATVEFALIVPVLLLLIFGIFEFGRLANAYMTLQHATREGARLSSLGASDAEIIAIIEDNAVTLDATRLSVQISPGEVGRTPGTIVTIITNYEFSVMIPVISTILGSPLQVTSRLSMRVE